MSNIEDEKKKLRQEYISIRNRIGNKNEKSKIIANKVINSNYLKKAKTIGIYMNLKSEVDTKKIIRYAIEKGKVVGIPKVNGIDLEFYKIDSINEQMEKSAFGVEEPETVKERLIEKEKIDLMIIPGICFDKANNRLGFGRGYYDRYLKDCNFIKVGICFEKQVLKDTLLPVTCNDIKVDKIVTEENIYE